MNISMRQALAQFKKEGLDRDGQIDALARMARLDPELMIELFGGETAFDAHVDRHIARIKAEDAARDRAATPAHTNDGDGGHDRRAGSGQSDET